MVKLKNYNHNGFKIKDVQVAFLEQSIKQSGFPKQTNIEFEEGLTEKDGNRSKKLASAKQGSGHDCFLKGIQVNFNMTCTADFLLQFNRYHFHDIISSQSKMHKILSMDIKSHCSDFVDSRAIELVEEKKRDYFKYKDKGNCDSDKLSELFERIIHNIPHGFKLTMGTSTNYLQLKSIYNQRKNHKLQSWRIFCKMIEELPKSYLITGVDNK